MIKPRPVIDRVMAKVVESETGCWVFIGGRSEGYGKAGLGSRTAGTDLTHRIVWRYFYGEIPAGLDLDHLCRNRACCNPWHLEPVTRKVNAGRGLRGPGYGPSVRTHCKWGHEFTPENTKMNGTARSCIACRRSRKKAA